ncbi:MAG: PAS domain S-box protein [Bryobacteraceae bacterium]|nr:PAS domain S-box protein [Bryobacteraceae bacterium]
MSAAKITFIYVVLGSAWIVGTDAMVLGRPQLASSGKGLLFVGITGALLFVLIHRMGSDLVKEAETARRAERQFRHLVEAAPVGIFEQLEGNFGYLNPAAVQMLGVTNPYELAGRNVIDHVHPDFHPAVRERMHSLRTMAGGVPPLEEVFFRADGTQFSALVSAVPFQKGEERGAIVCFTDLTERKTYDRWLRETADAMPVLVWVCSPAGAAVHLNQRWYEYTGQTEDRALGEGWLEVVHVDDRERVAEEWRKALEARSLFDCRLRYRRHDGMYRWHLARALPLVTAEGSLKAWFGVSLDIEESVKVAAELERARENERARIARDLHDELGQLLVVAKMQLDIARTRHGIIVEELQKASRAVTDAMRRTRDLARTLRPPVLDQAGLIGAIDWLVTEFKSSSGIECELFAPDEQASTLTPERQIAVFRILQEALTNVARHAAASRVTVEVVAGDGSISFIVHDDGRGFAAGAPNGSSSLGIIGMRERAVTAGGNLILTSAAGQGTTVRLDLSL